MSDTIALMWDCNGLEAAVNVTDIQKQKMWTTLKGEDTRRLPVEPNLMMWQLRAQANPQRFYEIYLVELEDGITVDDVCKAFEASPQAMADTIRKTGHPFYCNRRDEQEVRIR
jgi:hypothetical protein